MRRAVFALLLVLHLGAIDCGQDGNPNTAYVVSAATLPYPGSSDYSVSLWTRRETATVNYYPAGFCIIGGGEEAALALTSGNTLGYARNNFGIFGTTNQLIPAAWNHALLAENQARDSRSLWLNGDVANKGTNTNDYGTVTTPVLRLGETASVGGGFGGLKAFCRVAIWNEMLGDTEAVALSKGVDPRLIRPWALKAYWPATGDSYELATALRDVMGLLNVPRSADYPYGGTGTYHTDPLSRPSAPYYGMTSPYREQPAWIREEELCGVA